MTLLDAVLRVVLAMAVGGMVGLERELRDVPAGIRTHMLVCAGSTLITLVSIRMAGGVADPTRIAAQIVTGIGFLGAGTIFRSGSSVRGLTTAAGIWLVAGVGMGIAAGGILLHLGVITALLVGSVNTVVRVLEQRLIRSHCALRLTLSRQENSLGRILEELDHRGVRVHQLTWLTGEASPDAAVVSLALHIPASVPRSELTAWIGTQPGVRQVTWES
jgi:putative Mg2+ transporter-C (MgtC) family protein